MASELDLNCIDWGWSASQNDTGLVTRFVGTHPTSKKLVGNRVGCHRARLKMGAAACKTIKSLPFYSAGMSEVYTLDCAFPTLTTFYVKAFHEVSGFGGGFFTGYGSQEGFVALATFLVLDRNEVMTETTRNGFLLCSEKNVTDGFIRLVQGS